MRRFLRRLTAETVVVHGTTGTSIRGILRRADREVVVLSHAVLLRPDGETPLDGEQVIPFARVDFIQRLPAADAFGEVS